MKIGLAILSGVWKSGETMGIIVLWLVPLCTDGVCVRFLVGARVCVWWWWLVGGGGGG